MGTKTIIYKPDEDDKRKMNEACERMIAAMRDLTFEQKVTVLKIVTQTFTSHYKIEGVKIGEELRERRGV